MTTRKIASPRRMLAALCLAAMVGVSGLLLFIGARVGIAAFQLYDVMNTLRTLGTAPDGLELPALISELQRGDKALAVLETTSSRLERWATPELKLLTGAPLIGRTVRTTQDLLDLGARSTGLARTLLAVVQPHLASVQAEGKLGLDRELLLTAAAGRDFAALAPDFRNLAAAASRAAENGLPVSAQDQLNQLAQGARWAAAAAELGPHLNWLLGLDSPRTLLVLAQNNDELRATGGFIAAAGTITFDKGRITINDLVDSYAIYRTDVDHPPAPMALQQYMKAYILLLRDANWSPDAPTSAQTAADLYQLDTGVQVDGVLWLDTGAASHFVSALGSVALPGDNTTLTAANLEQQLIRLWNPKAFPAGESSDGLPNATASAIPASAVLPAYWWEQRKDFVPQVAHAVLQRVQAGGNNTFAVADALFRSLDDRSLQLWVKDPATAEVLSELGWDGALVPQAGADFLAVVDSNVGFNKADAVMQRSLHYTVDWPAASNSSLSVGPTAILTLTYTHTLSAADPGCDQTPRYGNSYADLTKRCYFDYVRVYAPPGSRLLSSSGLQKGSTTSTTGEKGLQVFAGFFVLPPGTAHSVTLTYELPPSLQQDDYALVLQRQAGVKPLPVTLRAGSATEAFDLEDGRLDWRPSARG